MVTPVIPTLVTRAGQAPMLKKRRARRRPKARRRTRARRRPRARRTSSSTRRMLRPMLKNATTSGTRIILNPQKYSLALFRSANFLTTKIDRFAQYFI